MIALLSFITAVLTSPFKSKIAVAQGAALQVIAKVPFLRVHETRRAPSSRARAPIRIRPPPIRNGRGFCRPRDRRSSAPFHFCCPRRAFVAACPGGRPFASFGASIRLGSAGRLRNPATSRMPPKSADQSLRRLCGLSTRSSWVEVAIESSRICDV